MRSILLRGAITACPDLIEAANPSRLSICLSRVLLLLAAIELVTMPVTQHLWIWDGFLHGGQDFELSLFVTVCCLCLVLLRAQHCRQNVGLLFAVWRFASEDFRRRPFLHRWLRESATLPAAIASESPGPSLRPTPLRI